MNWFWPRRLNEGATMRVRAGRLLHWSFAGLAILFTTVTLLAGTMQGAGEPVFYVTTILIWLGFAMLARGLRYLLASE